MKRHFAVYAYHFIYDGKRITRHLIVIKEGNVIVQWTNLHIHVRKGSLTRIKRIESDHKSRYYDVVKFLNFCIFDKQHARRVVDIEAWMIKEFLSAYGLCRLEGDTEETHRSEVTVRHMFASLVQFFDGFAKAYPDCKMKPADFWEEKEFFDKRKKRRQKRKLPAFEILCNPKTQEIFRDMPEAAFQLIFNHILTRYKDILMLVACSAFAGLRPGEACNVRREDSMLGRGLYIEMMDGEVHNIKIDIRKELNLRSDHVPVGNIKKARTQGVYPAFLDIFYQCYKIYMAYMKNRPYEADYGALSVCHNGKAFTYDNYRKRCKQAIEECIPIMLESDDPELVSYGHLLMEHSIGLHIFRHWYSVKLVLFGEDVSGLMYWRGDKSPESALRYLMDKSDLEKEFEKVNEKAFDFSMWKADKLIKE